MNTTKIEEIRQLRKISQEKFAGLIGMTKTGYQQAIKKGDFKVSTLKRIAAELHVDINLFLKDSYQAPPPKVNMVNEGDSNINAYKSVFFSGDAHSNAEMAKNLTPEQVAAVLQENQDLTQKLMNCQSELLSVYRKGM